MQYTNRKVRINLGAGLRSSAREQGDGPNESLIEAGSCGAGLPSHRRDLNDIVGSWAEDPAFDEAIADQDRSPNQQDLDRRTDAAGQTQ